MLPYPAGPVEGFIDESSAAAVAPALAFAGLYPSILLLVCKPPIPGEAPPPPPPPPPRLDI